MSHLFNSNLHDVQEFQSLHDRLRLATRAEHAALESAVGERRFFDSLPGYTEYLERFADFQSEAEQRLSMCGVESVIRDWPLRQRSHLALADLGSLGVLRKSYAARCDAWVISERAEHVLGTTYVLEGATLGGAVLLRSVAELGITAQRGGAFLASYGSARGAMWRAFLSTLADWGARGICEEEVERATKAAFAAARHYLLGERVTLAAVRVSLTAEIHTASN